MEYRFLKDGRVAKPGKSCNLLLQNIKTGIYYNIVMAVQTGRITLDRGKALR